jgi:hypothetical protein
MSKPGVGHALETEPSGESVELNFSFSPGFSLGSKGFLLREPFQRFPPWVRVIVASKAKPLKRLLLDPTTLAPG